DNVDPSPTVTSDAPGEGFVIGTTKVTWTATDASGNSASDTQTVTITEKKDTTAPTITDKSPSDGSTNVKVTSSITATFSEDVKGLDGSSFKLKDGTNSIAGTVTYDDVSKTGTLKPSADLKVQTKYDAFISS